MQSSWQRTCLACTRPCVWLPSYMYTTESVWRYFWNSWHEFEASLSYMRCDLKRRQTVWLPRALLCSAVAVCATVRFSPSTQILNSAGHILSTHWHWVVWSRSLRTAIVGKRFAGPEYYRVRWEESLPHRNLVDCTLCTWWFHGHRLYTRPPTCVSRCVRHSVCQALHEDHESRVPWMCLHHRAFLLSEFIVGNLILERTLEFPFLQRKMYL